MQPPGMALNEPQDDCEIHPKLRDLKAEILCQPVNQ
jgi:hypothetical protein